MTSLLQKLPPPAPARLAPAVIVAVAVANALAVGAALAFHGLTPAIAITSLALGTLAGIALLLTADADPWPTRRPGPFEWIVIGAFALASLRAFLWVLYAKGEALHVLSPYNLGDLSLHLGLIHYLASGIPFWPDSPILSGEPLRYPIGTDLFNSLLLLVGVPVREGLVWVGLVGAALTGCALWRWGRGFAIAALLFSGGLAAFTLFREGFTTGQWQLRDFMTEPEWPWKNFFLTMLVTQRGLLFALPAGLYILDDWRTRWFPDPRRATLPLWAPVLLYATMPLYSVHTFLFLSVVLAAVFLLAPGPTIRRATFQFGLLALLPATAATALVTGFFSAGGGIHWAPGWLQDDRPVWFWVRNFGAIPFLWIALFILTIRHGDRRAFAFLLPATVLFLTCCFVSFAPWPWDNVKLMLWCWLAITPFLWHTVLHPLTAVPRTALVVLLFFSGALSLVAGLDGRHGYKLIRRAELDHLTTALREIPRTARFASAPDYAHPLILLGRPVAVGYEGHLWSHGIDYKSQREALNTLMDREGPWQSPAAELGVTHLFWGRPERKEFLSSPKQWAADLPTAATGETFTIFELATPSPTKRD